MGRRGREVVAQYNKLLIILVALGIALIILSIGINNDLLGKTILILGLVLTALSPVISFIIIYEKIIKSH